MPSYAFFKGEYVPLAEAKLSVMTHALHYGTACFEGIRGNWNEEKQQMYLFRLTEHYQRLLSSCKVLKISLPYSVEELCRITVELARKCDFKQDIYLRPLAYKSSEALGVRLHDLESDFLVFIIPWGPYLDMDKARCAVSSWRRPDDNTGHLRIRQFGDKFGKVVLLARLQEHTGRQQRERDAQRAERQDAERREAAAEDPGQGDALGA